MNKPTALTLAPMLAFVLLHAHLLNAQSSPQSDGREVFAEWTLAACAFTVDENSSNFENTASDHAYKAASLLPQLILEKTLDAGMRTVPAEELCRREKKKLNEQRRALYADIGQKTAERDKLVVSEADEKKLQREIAAREKTIRLLKADAEKITEKETSLSPSDFSPVKEHIVLWKKTSTEAYPPLKTAAPFRETLEEPKDIRGLITGSIRRLGDYMQVQVMLTLYPGAVEVLHLSETDRMDNLEAFSQRFAEKIIVALRNGKEVRLSFDIQPADAAQKASVRLDGRLLHSLSSVLIADGIHELYAEAEGFEAASFVYDFSGKSDFYVRVRFQKRNETPIRVVPKAGGPYTLFFNGLAAVPHEGKEHTFTVNGFPVLAEAVEGDTVRRFILERGVQKKGALPENPGEYIAEYTLPPPGASLASSIEKKRRIMYNSYAALILSLPAAFILVGKQVDEYNSCVLGRNGGDDLQNWQIAAYTASGVSIGLGINFLVQLGLYLHSVNSLLPERIKADKPR